MSLIHRSMAATASVCPLASLGMGLKETYNCVVRIALDVRQMRFDNIKQLVSVDRE